MRRRAAVRWPLSLFYAGFGVLHLARGAAFLPIMPAWVPDPAGVIAATGVCEILGGLGLAIPLTRRLSGIMLALYAVCVFPANLHHAFDHVRVPGLPSSWWYHAPRLALQPVLVWAALFAGGVVDWPWRSEATRGQPSPHRSAEDGPGDFHA
jgi:uncharacterized membrane protein